MEPITYTRSDGRIPMKTRSELEQITRSIYNARDRNDANATAEGFHADSTFQIIGCDALAPLSSRVTGKAEIALVLEQLSSNWDFSKVQTINTFVDGDTVIVKRKGKVRFVPTNRTFEAQWVDILRFQDGLVTDFEEYIDTHQIASILNAN
jgi:ketosteroid isomerase-like protein